MKNYKHFELKGTFSDFASWDDNIKLHSLKFFGKYTHYPHLLLASEETLKMIDEIVLKHKYRNHHSKRKKAKNNSTGINSFEGHDYKLDFCTDNDLPVGDFILIFDEEEYLKCNKHNLNQTNGKKSINYYDDDYDFDKKTGLHITKIENRGYGFINERYDLVISPKYIEAENYSNGFAVVSVWDDKKNKVKWIALDKNGCEIYFDKDYVRIFKNRDNMFRVSELDIGGWGNWDYPYSDEWWEYDDYVGVFGYADNYGKEIIRPQYIVAYDFTEGMAIVCKGKWNLKEEWHNGHKQRKYISDEALWGVIDKTGKEIVPCKYRKECDIYRFLEKRGFVGEIAGVLLGNKV